MKNFYPTGAFAATPATTGNLQFLEILQINNFSLELDLIG